MGLVEPVIHSPKAIVFEVPSVTDCIPIAGPKTANMPLGAAEPDGLFGVRAVAILLHRRADRREIGVSWKDITRRALALRRYCE